METFLRPACLGLIAGLLSSLAVHASEVTVEVVDTTGAPVAGASVYVLSTGEYGTRSRHMVSEGHTDDNGICAFDCTDGDLILACKEGFGLDWSGTAQYSYSSDAARVQLMLSEEGHIGGRVIDAQGQPIVGATVAISPGKSGSASGSTSGWLDGVDAFTTKTNRDGAFLLKGIPKGTCLFLKASHPEYAVAVLGERSVLGTSEDAIHEGQTNTVVQMDTGYKIMGKVTFQVTGEPAAEAIVAQDVQFGKSPIPSCVEKVLTDGNGDYVIRVPQSSLNSLYVLHPLSCAEGRSCRIEFRDDRSGWSTGNDIAIPKRLAVRGRFVNAQTGEQIPGDRIEAIVSGSRVPVGADGMFSFSASPLGLAVEGTCVFESIRVPFWQALRLTKESLQQGMTLRITPPKFLTGKVLGPDGHPLGNAVVSPRWGHLDEPDLVRTSSDGSFRIPIQWLDSPQALSEWLEGTRAFVVDLSVSFHTDTLRYHRELSRVFPRQPTSSAESRLATLLQEEWLIQLVQLGSIRGRVVDIAGKGLQKATVEARGNGATEKTHTDKNGDYELGVDCKVPYSVSAHWSGWGETQSVECTVVNGEEIELTDLVLKEPRQTLEGAVTDASGTPLSGMWILVKAQDAQQVSTRTDSAGRFKVTGTPGGPLKVSTFDRRPNTTIRGSAEVPPYQGEVTIVAKTK